MYAFQIQDLSEATRGNSEAVHDNEAAGNIRQTCFHGVAVASAHAAYFALHLRVGRAVQPHPWPACYSPTPFLNTALQPSKIMYKRTHAEKIQQDMVI